MASFYTRGSRRRALGAPLRGAGGKGIGALRPRSLPPFRSGGGYCFFVFPTFEAQAIIRPACLPVSRPLASIRLLYASMQPW